MRTLAGTLLASALLLPIPATARPSELTVPGGSVRVAQRGAHSVVSGIVKGRPFSLALPAEEGIFAGSFDGVEFVGALPGRVLILSIDYLSRPEVPMGQCGAGVETVLRVVSLRPQPRQSFHQLVASCWYDIEPGEISWDAATSSLIVERQVFSKPAEHTRTRYHVNDEGSVIPDKVENLP